MLMCFDLKFYFCRILCEKTEGDSGKNAIKQFFPLFPQTPGLHGGGQSACRWQCISRAVLAGPMWRMQSTDLSSVATRPFWVSLLCPDTQSLANVWCRGFSLVLFPLKFTTQCQKFSVSIPHSPNVWLSSYSAIVIWSRWLITANISGKLFQQSLW